MSDQADSAPADADRGFMVGELLVAVFLLIIAISSVTALMYSVTHHPRTRTEECLDRNAKISDKCAAPAKASTTKSKSASRLLLAGCATRSGAAVQECRDSVAASKTPGATTLRSRTDSASLELLPKKPQRAPRTDLGFVR